MPFLYGLIENKLTHARDKRRRRGRKKNNRQNDQLPKADAAVPAAGGLTDDLTDTDDDESIAPIDKDESDPYLDEIEGREGVAYINDPEVNVEEVRIQKVCFCI